MALCNALSRQDFPGRGKESTAGSDFRYSAMAARSDAGNCDVFLMTNPIEPETASKVGVWPLSRKSAKSFSDQSPSAFWVMLGTKPSPSGLGPPAKRRAE